MTDDVMQATLATWAARDLPARLDVAQTSKLLGFGEHDIQILMAVGKLTPLGEPAPNAPKWFAAVEMIRLAADRESLPEHRRNRRVIGQKFQNKFLPKATGTPDSFTVKIIVSRLIARRVPWL